MSTDPLRRSKRIRGLEVSPEISVVEHSGVVETEAKLEVPAKDCISTGTQTPRPIGHSAPSLGAGSLNPIGSTGVQTTSACNYRKLLLQQRPRDSGLGEQTVVEQDDPGEAAEARERASTYPPPPGSRAASRLNLVEAGIEGAQNTESLRWDSSDLREESSGSRSIDAEEASEERANLGLHGWRGLPRQSRESSVADSTNEEEFVSESSDSSEVSRAASPLVMAHRPPAPQLKYRAPPIFCGKKEEDAADWLERYESTALYNRWGPDEMAENFGMHVDGAARKWFLCAGAPDRWEDIPALAAEPGIAAVPAVDGL